MTVSRAKGQDSNLELEEYQSNKIKTSDESILDYDSNGFGGECEEYVRDLV